MNNISNSIISMVNGIECSVMRQTFLNLQDDENATNCSLVADALCWNSYLDIYCLIYRDINRNIPTH